MDTMTVEDSSHDDENPDEATSPDAVEDPTSEAVQPGTSTPATPIDPLRYPLYEEWEELEDAEAEQVTRQHKRVVSFPALLQTLSS